MRFLLSCHQSQNVHFFPINFLSGGQIQQLRLATLRWADDGCVGITLPVTTSHRFRIADSGNLTTRYNIQICSFIMFYSCLLIYHHMIL